MRVKSFYVTTVEADHRNREHNYRLVQGETLPQDHLLKTQREAGNFKFADSLSLEQLAALAQFTNSL
jgi:hypothetical protein